MKEKLMNYFTFTGRISRRHLFFGQLKLVLVNVIALPFLALICFSAYKLYANESSYRLAVIIGAFACSGTLFSILLGQIVASASLIVRRLHDLNYSGWYAAVYFAAAIGIGALQETWLQHTLSSNWIAGLNLFTGLLYAFTLLGLFLLPGDKEANRFGASTRLREELG